MTPSEQIDALAEAYYTKLHEGDCSPAYDELNAGRQERHRRAVRALLLRLTELGAATVIRSTWTEASLRVRPVPSAAHEVMPELERLRLVDRLKQKQRQAR